MELGGRMAEHTAVKVTVARFVDRKGLASDGVVLHPSPNKCSETNYSFSTATMNREKEQGLDEAAVEEFRRKWETAVYIEKAASNIVEEVLGMGRSGDYDLIVAGNGRFPSSMVVELAEMQAELGPIGDILASSVLVIQQHNVELADEAPMSKVHGEYYESSSMGKGASTSNDNNI